MKGEYLSMQSSLMYQVVFFIQLDIKLTIVAELMTLRPKDNQCSFDHYCHQATLILSINKKINFNKEIIYIIKILQLLRKIVLSS